jgi:hypothetical protein
MTCSNCSRSAANLPLSATCFSAIMSTADSTVFKLFYSCSPIKSGIKTSSFSSGAITNHDKSLKSTDFMMSVSGNMAVSIFGSTVLTSLTTFHLLQLLMIKFSVSMVDSPPTFRTSMTSGHLTENRKFPTLEPCVT